MVLCFGSAIHQSILQLSGLIDRKLGRKHQIHFSETRIINMLQIFQIAWLASACFGLFGLLG